MSGEAVDEKAARWEREVREWQESLQADIVTKTEAISKNITASTNVLSKTLTAEEAERRNVERMDFDTVFPVPGNAWLPFTPKARDWMSTNIVAQECEKLTVFRVNGRLVPDWMYGFTAIQHDASLPEVGSDEEIKAGIFAVMEDCLVRKARDIRDLLENYNIMAVEFQGDFVTKTLRVIAVTNRQVMAVNTVMTNKKVRSVMIGRVVVDIHTQVEPHRRTDDYLHPQPQRQHLLRTFVFHDRVLVRNEPESWSAGSSYDTGDVLSIGGLTWRVGDDPLDSIAGFAVRRGPEDRAALGARERAYAQAARNR
jgi:hypothetical protein